MTHLKLYKDSAQNSNQYLAICDSHLESDRSPLEKG